MAKPADLAFVPKDSVQLTRFGKGDERKLRRYLLMLAAFLEGRNQNTKDVYRRAIQQFFGLFQWVSPEDVTVAHAVAFKRWLLDEKLSVSSVYTRLSAMSAFFKFLCQPSGANEEPLIRFNPFEVMSRKDVLPTPYGRSVAMEWTTFVALLDALPADAAGLRNKAILIFFAFTGRRRAEVAGLLVQDLNLNARPRTYTARMKGGEIKTFQLPDVCYEAIRAYWLAAGRLKTLKPTAGVFTAIDGHGVTAHLDKDKPIGIRAINELLSRTAERAGLQANTDITVHAMRHMSARDLDRAGVRLQDIQHFLGQANPNTTSIYLGKISGPISSHEADFKRVREEMAKIASDL